MGWGSIVSAGASLVGGLMGKKSGEEQQENNAALQKEFAQNGIRWKVADAKAAGIHPLAALGAQTQSYTPMVIGDPMADALANAGQDIGGAINRQQTNQERADTMAKQTAAVAARQKSSMVWQPLGRILKILNFNLKSPYLIPKFGET